jgi:transposase
MNANPSSSAQNWREGRRLRAWELKQAGWTQQAIAEALGVTPGAVSQWCKRAVQQGVEALRHRPPPGPRLRLSPEQLQQLPALLERGAEAHGFRGEVWTHARIALVIARTFGVTYHPNHIGRVLKRIGWSRQKPVKRATQRDEVAIARWRNGGWAESEKRL